MRVNRDNDKNKENNPNGSKTQRNAQTPPSKKLAKQNGCGRRGGERHAQKEEKNKKFSTHGPQKRQNDIQRKINNRRKEKNKQGEAPRARADSGRHRFGKKSERDRNQKKWNKILKKQKSAEHGRSRVEKVNLKAARPK